MPTILELFKGSPRDISPNIPNQTPVQQKFKGSTQEKAVKADKDTLIEQELTGIRKNTGVDLNTPRLYGSETIRIASRTTSLVEDMKAQTGGQAATGGLIGKGLGKLTGGRLNSISDVRNKFNSVLGIPITQIPSRVSNKVIELSSANSITSQDVITKDLIGGQGSGVGKFLKGLGGGDFKTLGKQALGNGIGLAKDKLRGALFGKPQTIGEASGQKIQLTYNNTNKYSTVLKDNRDYKSEGGDVKEFTAIDITLVSPVYGVRRKDGQFGSLKSGNSEIYGFEYVKKENSRKPLSRWVPDSKYSESESFKGQTLESKRGLKNGIDVVNMMTPSDTVQISPDGEFDYLGQKYADLIPFYIGKLGAAKTMFRSNIKGITETVSPSWNSHKFLGNPYQFYTYSQIERSVAFNLQIYTSSPLELATNWEKLTGLTQMTYPSIQANGLVSPPIIDFTLGDVYHKKIGFIDSLSYTIPDDATWETEINGAKLPKFIDVSISIKFIEDSTSVNTLYGLEKSKDAVKAINDSTRANDYSDQQKTGVDSVASTPPAMTPRGLVPTPEDLKPKISISSPLTEGSIKKPYVQSVDSKSSSTTTETPETTESPVSNPIVNQSAMVDGLKAETPAKAIEENSKTYSKDQSTVLASLSMSFPVSRGDSVSVIPQTELPENWISDPWPQSDAIYVKVITKRKQTKWFWIGFFGDTYPIFGALK